MPGPQDIRDEFVDTLGHIRDCFHRVRTNSGPKGVLKAPDVHKLSEGLFLSAWTYWEEFLRELLILDLATLPSSVLRSQVRAFKSKVKAPAVLAREILGHPDETSWVEWSRVSDVIARADRLLSAHRYTVLRNREPNIRKLSTIRNAVAHKSDHAWRKFRDLAKTQPFSLKKKQMKGLTTGRFVSSHTWGAGGSIILEHVVDYLEDTAKVLVP